MIPRIYIADTAPLQDTERYNALYAAVSDRRRAKTDRLRFRKDRILSLGAESLLMQACRDSGLDYARERILTDPNGKPVFSDAPLHFNLSHSGERVMCIIADVPVGCDVEQVCPTDPEIIGRCFCPGEAEWIRSAAERAEEDQRFFRIWTLKESYLKCTGRGFRLDPSDFEITVTEHGIRLEHGGNDRPYQLSEWDLQDGYRYASCMEIPKERALTGPQLTICCL